MPSRIKVRCITNTPFGDGALIHLSAVTGGSPENDSFFRKVPQGTIELGVVEPEAAKELVAGKTYYVDITEADSDAAA